MTTTTAGVLNGNAVGNEDAGNIGARQSWRCQLTEQFQQNASRVEAQDASFYGFPAKVGAFFRNSRGVSRLYDWQEKLLCHPAVTHGQNLIISLPTGGGKTLLAEMLILKEILWRHKDVLFVLPYVSIVQERVKGLVPLGLDMEFLVEEYASSKGRIPPIKRRRKKSVYIATIEKAQTLFNSLLETKRLDNIGLVVIDELHLLGEGRSRGSALEELIVKLMFCAPACQLIGISATLSNMDQLKAFMKAELFIHDFRPVDLAEYVKLDNLLYKVNPKAQAPNETLIFHRKLHASNPMDPDNLCQLVMEVVPYGSCLIFCSSKKSAENVCLLLSKFLHEKLRNHRSKAKREFLAKLSVEGNNRVCQILKTSVPCGVAYHHSGLTSEERQLIQDAFVSGVLCIICCTSTLAAGVNLPAKRVILRNFMIGNRFMCKQEYKQMTGRAGRAGFDDYGESIAITNMKHRDKVQDLLCKRIEDCHTSLLYANCRGLKNLMLSVVCLKIVTNRSDLAELLKSTLLYIQSKDSDSFDIDGVLKEALKFLIEEKMMIMRNGVVKATNLGEAVCKSGIDADIAQRVRSDLIASLKSMNLVSHLQLVYCVVPYSIDWDGIVQWDIMYEEFNMLEDEDKQVLRAIGMGESYLIRKRLCGSSLKSKDLAIIPQRMFCALILRRIWLQENPWDTALRFRITRGTVQQILRSSISFAHALTRFVDNMEELWALRSLLPDFIKRLQYNAEAEIIPLMDISGVQKARARELCKAGYKSVAEVAQADAASLVKVLSHVSRPVAYQIIRSAKMLLQEQVESLLESVETILGVDQSHDFTLDNIIATLRSSV